MPTRLGKTSFLLAVVAAIFGWWFTSGLPVQAAPPVRIAIVPGGGSGMEQSAVDGISARLEGNSSIALSTVNPDWYVVCNIVDQTDIVSGTVRVNGTVTIKTTDGHVINTVSVQTNKQDFSLQPGAPLNKAMVQGAVQEVISGMTERAVRPIQEAVDLEIGVRDHIISAESLADKDKYDEAISQLMPIGPETPHFKAVRSLIDEYQMEKEAYGLVKEAEAQAKKGNYSQAIKTLSGVNQKSKRYKVAKERQADYRAALARLARNKPAAKAKPTAQVPSSDAQLKALEAQKKALDAQRKAVEAQEAALKNRTAK